MEGLGTS